VGAPGTPGGADDDPGTEAASLDAGTVGAESAVSAGEELESALSFSAQAGSRRRAMRGTERVFVRMVDSSEPLISCLAGKAADSMK
jgi:hypothetical protein